MHKNDTIDSIKQWTLYLEGNDSAYAWLYSHYVQELFQYGCRFTRDEELVKDSIQDVFSKLYQNRDKISLPENVRFYLMHALKNNLINKFEKKQGYLFLSDFFSSDYEFELSVEETFITKEKEASTQQFIKEMLSELSPRQKEIIYYRFFEGLDYPEICQLMGLNYQSAYNLVQRSLIKLREINGVSSVMLLLTFQFSPLDFFPFC